MSTLTRSLTAGLFGLLLLAPPIALATEITQADASQVPTFHPARPWVGIQASFSTSGLGSSALHSASLPISGQLLPVELQFDVEPIQSIGVISLGPSLQYQAQLAPAGAQKWSSPILVLWAPGAQIRYQAHYAHYQLFVPTVAYEIQSWNYKTTTTTPGQFIASGPSAGLWINLGAIDRRTSRASAEALGIQRSYLTLDWKKLEGGDSLLGLSGDSYQLGLRIEI